MGNTQTFFWFSFLFLVFSCNPPVEEPVWTGPDNALFQSIPADASGIDFQNKLTSTEEFNAYLYRNFYNGAGVGIGDVNNDGLPDLYFCGNMVDNKLYLNKGSLEFEDITDRAGVACKGVWSTGVSMVDVNGDGWLDIYVCKSGTPGGENRHNELFINNGDLTFTEQAAAYGIDDMGLSSHAAFFDFDLDGDLDCYLLNNSFRPVGQYDLRPGQRNTRDTMGGNRLYRNDDNRFVDISEEANIYGSNIGFGLGVTVGDVNRDGWPDLYVSNDFFEKDYLYINQKDGTYREALEEQIREISLSSMGADMADINNDTWPDIFVTDMLPEDNRRQKTKTTFENWDKYILNQQNGYYRQFTRNTLQLNNGNETFSEIGRLAGVYATDWSWGALIFDMDNDGLKDLFVANGIAKDLTDQDYINFFANPRNIREILKKEGAVIQTLIDSIPSERIPNYAFINQGNYQFENRADALGLGQPSFSNGSAYGDLDQDGDLDLVVNNVDMPAFLYKNTSNEKEATYLQLRLKGGGKNPFGIGTQVTVFAGNETYYQSLFPMRGFMSTVDHVLHFGLAAAAQVDSIQVRWPGGAMQRLYDVSANQQLTISFDDAEEGLRPKHPSLLFRQVEAPALQAFSHEENWYVDFDRDRLLYHMRSTEGPRPGIADVDGDGLSDAYLPGAKGISGSLLIQKKDGSFSVQTKPFEADQNSEDTDCLFFDANGDGALDLMVTSGGNEFNNTNKATIDRLYFNDGRGGFTKSEAPPLPRFAITSCVDAADFDQDGDQDLFVGSRLRARSVGVPVDGFLLENDGSGKFAAVQQQTFKTLGLLTDVVWADYDSDGDVDLFLSGEWMPIRLFQNEAGTLREVEIPAFSASPGLWNCIKVADLNGDQRMDLVAGNHGLNTRLRASEEKPLHMYINDFDQNGTVEQVLTAYNGEEAYPFALRHDLVMQMPGLKKKFLKYASYQDATITDVFTPEQLERAIKLTATEVRSCAFIQQADGTFEKIPLPMEAQFAPVYGLYVEDLDADGAVDLLIGGNFHESKPEVGIYDASYGWFLKGWGDGRFEALPARHTGLLVKGQVRDIQRFRWKDRDLILFARNNQPYSFFTF